MPRPGSQFHVQAVVLSLPIVFVALALARVVFYLFFVILVFPMHYRLRSLTFTLVVHQYCSRYCLTCVSRGVRISSSIFTLNLHTFISHTSHLDSPHPLHRLVHLFIKILVYPLSIRIEHEHSLPEHCYHPPSPSFLTHTPATFDLKYEMFMAKLISAHARSPFICSCYQWL